MRPEFEREGDCKPCIKAAQLREVWNRNKEKIEHVNIWHCVHCNELVLRIPNHKDKSFYEQEWCQWSIYHTKHHPDREASTSARGQYPLNDPATVKGQLDEGGHPWGNIPQGVVLGFDNSVLDNKREDIMQPPSNGEAKRPELAKIRVLPPLQHPPIGIDKKVDIEQEKLYTLRSRTLLSGGSKAIDWHTSLQWIRSELEEQAIKAKWDLEQEKKKKDEPFKRWVCQQFLEDDEAHRNLKTKGKHAEALRRYQDFHMLVSNYEFEPKTLPVDVAEQERK